MKHLLTISIFILFYGVGLFQAQATQCNMSRRGFLGSLGAAVAVAGAPGATGRAILAGGSMEAASGSSVLMARLLDCSRGMDEATRRWLRASQTIGLDPSDLSVEQRAQITRFLREVRSIANDPQATAQLRHLAGQLTTEVRVAMQPVAGLETARQATQRPGQETIRGADADPADTDSPRARAQDPEQPTASRSQEVVRSGEARPPRRNIRDTEVARQARRIGFRGLGSTLARIAAPIIGAALEITSASPAHGGPGSEYIINNGENLHRFFDLPADMQNFLLESNSRLREVLEEHFNQVINDLGGQPTEISCSGTETSFRIRGSDIDSTHREVVVTRNSQGEIQTAHITEFNGEQQLRQGQVQLSNMTLTRVTPQLGNNHRNLAAFNQTHTAEDFNNIVTGQHPRGVMAFLQKLGNFDLYLNLVLDQIDCDSTTTSDAPAAANLQGTGVY